MQEVSTGTCTFGDHLTIQHDTGSQYISYSARSHSRHIMYRIAAINPGSNLACLQTCKKKQMQRISLSCSSKAFRAVTVCGNYWRDCWIEASLSGDEGSQGMIYSFKNLDYKQVLQSDLKRLIGVILPSGSGRQEDDVGKGGQSVEFVGFFCGA